MILILLLLLTLINVYMGVILSVQIKYSIMHPGTHVWPHTGPTNCRLRMHLGLVIPKEGCKIRCANETRYVSFVTFFFTGCSTTDVPYRKSVVDGIMSLPWWLQYIGMKSFASRFECVTFFVLPGYRDVIHIQGRSAFYPQSTHLPAQLPCFFKVDSLAFRVNRLP